MRVWSRCKNLSYLLKERRSDPSILELSCFDAVGCAKVFLPSALDLSIVTTGGKSIVGLTNLHDIDYVIAKVKFNPGQMLRFSPRRMLKLASSATWRHVRAKLPAFP